MQSQFTRAVGILILASSTLFWGTEAARPQTSTGQENGAGAATQAAVSSAPAAQRTAPLPLRSITVAQRKAAAVRAAARRAAAAQSGQTGGSGRQMVPMAGGMPDYFGPYPNYANSPFPTVTNGTVTGGIRKFVDSLPGVGLPGCDPKSSCNANNLGNYIPVAVADQMTYPGSDYYQIGLFDYTWQFHTDLPNTTLVRGYRDMAAGADGKNHYLGPLILAQRNKPVRVKFVNKLGTGQAGNLFIPVDVSAMGAGMGPTGAMYTQNRATLHLHGGNTPWISDGTPHQWVTPAGENTPYKKGLGFQNVPGMAPGPSNPTPSDGDGIATFYWTNQQSARLMFFHDHSYGTTRLNVYAGSAAGYLVWDQFEEDLISGTNVSGVNPGLKKVLPDLGGAYHYGIPLIIQDRTFVPPPAQLAAEDPTWDTANWGGYGGLWFPHVYMPNQNPADRDGTNAMGRWDYGPWFWPPITTTSNPPLIHGTVPNPYYVSASLTPTEAPENPGIPNPSMVPESYMDTMVVNGTAYPYLQVAPQAYRFRILNASNDRSLNLQLYYADPARPTEVRMVAAGPTSNFPPTWPVDGRAGGVPDPTLAGPAMIQIGSEGGFLPAPAVIPATPVGYEYDRRSVTVLNVSTHALLIGPAERADVIVDFSGVPSGSILILYNDSPAPIPGIDERLDYYTGDADHTDVGGAPSTIPGYGPNTRTIMQFKVSGTAGKPFDLATLNAVLPVAYAASQPPPIVPESAYGASFGTSLTNTYSGIADTSLTYTPPVGAVLPVYTPEPNSPFPPSSCVSGTCNVPMLPKAIQELFELNYGRMNATLGVEMPFTNANTQTTIPLGYIDPVTETMNNGDTQIWKITHNGVDTHFIHFHLFNVQLINRVGWDGVVKPPDDNEMGWKETVRMNPLEDTIVALRPMVPAVPFDVPVSLRPPDVTSPANATIQVTSPLTGNVISIVNDPNTNYGWEYVWHCHILGHEENDMMRPMAVNVPSFNTGVPAAILNPWPGTYLTNSATTFHWGEGLGNITGYQLLVGTTGVGAGDLLSAGSNGAPIPATTTSLAASGLPIDGSTIYVRLVTQIAGVWQAPRDYTYVAPRSAPSVTLTATPNPAEPGAAVTLTATVTPGPLTIPTGTIAFKEGNVVLGSVAVARGSGTASFTVSGLATGSNSIVAEYSGNASLGSSDSAAVNEVVNDTTPDYSLSDGASAGGGTVKLGSSMTMNVTLTPVNGYAGTVTFICNSPMAGIGCVVNPASVTANGQPTNVAVTVSTAATVAGLIVPAAPSSQSSGMGLWASVGGVGIFGCVLVGFAGKSRWVSMICLTVLMGMIVGTMAACGGGSAAKPVTPVSPLVGQQTVTVYATGVGSSPVNHQITLTFTVAQ